MLRDRPALAIPDRDGETGPATRLLREGILIPDLMVAFNINAAVSMWPASPPGAVTPCGVSVAPPRSWRGWALQGNPSPAPGGNWSTGAPASRQGHPGSVPKRKALPLLEGRERETQARRPEAKDQGSPKTDRNNQPGKPGHSLRQGAALGDAEGG